MSIIRRGKWYRRDVSRIPRNRDRGQSLTTVLAALEAEKTGTTRRCQFGYNGVIENNLHATADITYTTTAQLHVLLRVL